jgi:hypothetical protein
VRHGSDSARHHGRTGDAGWFDASDHDAEHSETRADTLPLSAWKLGSNLAHENPAEAAQWASGLPASKEQIEATKGVAMAWAETDPSATAKWIESLPHGTARDGAAAGLALDLAGPDPKTAFELAESVHSTAERTAALHAVVDAWKYADAAAARQTVESSKLEAAEKDALLGRLGLPKRRPNMVVWEGKP